ncbi:hypothetical protein HK105_206938 [Polyrhizophydium stewartii]|uniref:J domain-containing protein n=1 Tax=Polyrhizophydium stewartii TaxID=2732419 RepID=A0ABR4N1R6_9FUNG|nr:hypothetical protein HK105_005687 [Polyrhizophydium stewartii]
MSLPESERKLKHERFVLIQEAYDLLQDEYRRHEYDSVSQRPSAYAASSQGSSPPGSYENVGSEPPFSKLEFVYPLFLGFLLVGIVGYIWINSNIESRKRQEDLAWEYYRIQRHRDGLGDIVGQAPLRKR